jgi:hypothetical protein
MTFATLPNFQLVTRQKVLAILNDDNFSIEPGLVDDYTEMVNI